MGKGSFREWSDRRWMIMSLESGQVPPRAVYPTSTSHVGSPRRLWVVGAGVRARLVKAARVMCVRNCVWVCIRLQCVFVCVRLWIVYGLVRVWVDIVWVYLCPVVICACVSSVECVYICHLELCVCFFLYQVEILYIISFYISDWYCVLGRNSIYLAVNCACMFLMSFWMFIVYISTYFFMYTGHESVYRSVISSTVYKCVLLVTWAIVRPL